jgi:hypothetical protein
MTRHSLRRSLAAGCTAVFAAGILGFAVGGSASAEVPSGTRTQTATPPPPGGGVQITVEQPKPLGPLSFT